MLSTAVSILAAVALLMPGFIIAELGGGRSPRSSRSDLELALRALAFTIVVQLIFGFWTAHLVKTIGPSGQWADHFWAISAYVAVVLLAVPIAAGVLVNVYVVRVEDRDGPPGRIATFLGAGEARDAFDYAYQRWREEGGYVIVELIDHCPGAPRLVGGVYGKRSAVGQTPQTSRHLPRGSLHCRGGLKRHSNPRRAGGARSGRLHCCGPGRPRRSGLRRTRYPLGMGDSSNKRLQEGALSALKTPVNPPAPPKLVPLHEHSGCNGAKPK